MKTPQIIEVDLSEFYFNSLRRIVDAYRNKDMKDVEDEILEFMDIYESFIGEPDER